MKSRVFKPWVISILFAVLVSIMPIGCADPNTNDSIAEISTEAATETEEIAKEAETSQDELEFEIATVSETEEPTTAIATEATQDHPSTEVAAEVAQTLPSTEVTLSVADIPAYSGSPYVAINDNIPQFAETELSTSSYEFYSDLDSLGRCGVVYACIGQDLMPIEERGNIGSVKPTGWHTVKYDVVDGKYLYNRCHLIGYQLSGENANTKNLITGTRYMNVDGMLPFENMVADYVQETGNHVMYRVTPIFEGDNLLASGVQMEAQSVEDNGEGVLFNVFCYNVQPEVTIDYASGESSYEGGEAVAESKGTNSNNVTNKQTVEETEPEPASDANASIIVHITDSGEKYHSAGCQYLKKSDHEVSLSDAKARNFTPCSKCNPPQ